ncbi:TIGR04222 domain-containing membrane protein [Archangium primigenium]|uniref:TIGR04222 domain-containing membrane protein n=1 Tax=[Archangium] primigenium TaxID=2792470 RepID=UPI0019560D49|nr:TIGR04222 domain-containing membrane protein [Archangium primigenium]
MAFLAVYLPLLGVGYFLVKRWKRTLNRPVETPGPRELDLSPFEAAMMDGSYSPLDAAVAALVQRGCLRFEKQEHRMLQVAGALPDGVPAFERAVYRAVASGPVSFHAVHETLARELDALEAALVARGFLRDTRQQVLYAVLPWGSFLLLLFVGWTRFFFGLSERSGAGGLLWMSLTVGTGAWFVLLGGDYLTPRGAEAQRLLRDKYRALRPPEHGTLPPALSPDQIARVVGLFGVRALDVRTHGALREFLDPPLEE